MNENFNSANQTENTHHSDAIESSDALDDSAANSYGRLENDWLEAVNIHDLPKEYNDEDGSEDSGEFIPNEDESDDDDDSAMDPVDESFEELSMKKLNYQLAITDVMDQYSIGKTIFSQVELDDIRTKEQILIERGDKGYYRNKKVHGNAY